MIKLLIVDDNALVREGITELLRDDTEIEVVGVAADGIEAIDLAITLLPDVILMDLAMPNLDGVAATRAIIAALPAAAIVVLTTYDATDHLQAALEAGALGYLIKEDASNGLSAAVKAAANGLAPFTPSAAATLLEDDELEE